MVFFLDDRSPRQNLRILKDTRRVKCIYRVLWI